MGRSTLTGSVSGVAILGGDLFAGLSDGSLLRSDASTKSWTRVFQIPTARSSPGVISFAVGSSGYWAGGVGVLHSSDETNWEDVTKGLGTLSADAQERPRLGVVGLVPVPDGVIAAIAGNLPEVGVWRLDPARGWQRIGATSLGQPIALAQADKDLVLLTARGGVRPDGSSTPAAWISKDSGATWSAADYTGGSGAVLRAVVDAQGAPVAAAADGLVELVGSDWRLVAGWSASDSDLGAISWRQPYVYAATGDTLVRYRIQTSP